jgi:hypothetical protein
VFVVESSATFGHAPDAVYAALASLEAMLRWQAGVHGVRRPAARPHGPLVLTYRALGGRHALTARVTAAEPPRLFAYHAVGAAFALAASYRVEPAPGGSLVACRLALTTGAPAGADGGRLGDAASRLPAPDGVALRRLLARRAADDLVRLERWVRARQRVDAPRRRPGAGGAGPPAPPDPPDRGAR